MVRLFKKTADELLVEVHPDQADAERAQAMCSRIANAEYDVLWTPEEMAEARARWDAEAAQAAADAKAIAAAASNAEQERSEAAAKRDGIAESAAAKLRAFGLTEEEISVLVGR